MPHFEMVECPVCGKTAYGRNEIDKEFGIDMMVLCHSHGVENAEVWEVAADTQNVRFGG